MTRNSRKMLILSVFCTAGLLIAIPGFLFRSQNSNVTSVKSALLNPKYINEVNEITLSFPSGYNEESMTFQKNKIDSGETVWSCITSDGMIFPVNETIINQLIAHASETRSMTEISNSYAAWSALGLSDDTAISMTFSSSSSNGSLQTFSSLFFGYTNADGTMIYVRNDRKSTSWRIQNDFSSYLSDNCAFWADQRLLPVVRKDETDPGVSCISVSSPEGISKIYNDDVSADTFDEAVHTLLSLRSSELCSPDVFENQMVRPELLFSVTLEHSSSHIGQSYGLKVFQAQYTEEPFFFVQNYGINGKGEARYYQVISTWTYNKLIEALAAAR